MKEHFQGKTILVVGGTGTIGRKIVEDVLKYKPKAIRVFSRDEHKQYEMQQDLNKDYKEALRFLVGDVREYDRVVRASIGCDYIFHLAAMKHVPSCEYNPFEAVKTNVIGTQNIISAAIENNVSRVVFTSSDKAIGPTNAMGATKLLAEKLMASADYFKGPARTIFSAVRFGNVMGSRGSVIPMFKKQIIEDKKVTVTDVTMSRFMMSISEAASLTIKAALIAKGGETFVLKMPVVNLGDLGNAVIEETCRKYGIKESDVIIDQIGLRPGEKRYEELMTQDEAEAAYEFEDMYVITPVFSERNYKEIYKGIAAAESRSYSSMYQVPICKDEIKEILLKHNLI